MFFRNSYFIAFMTLGIGLIALPIASHAELQPRICSGISLGTVAAPAFVPKAEAPIELTAEEQNLLGELSAFRVRPLANPKVVDYLSRRNVHPVVLLRVFAQELRTFSKNRRDAARIAKVWNKHLDVVLKFPVADLKPVRSDLQLVLNGAVPHMTASDWARLLVYSKVLFSKENFAWFLATAIRGYTNLIEKSGRYPGLSQYQRFKLAKETLNKALGLPHESIAAALVVEDPDTPGSFSIAAFGTDPINGEVQKEGFAYKTLAQVQVGRRALETTVAWKAGDRDVSAEVHINPLRVSSLVPTMKPAPDYKTMWSDGRLTGAILISANLEKFSPQLASYYGDYAFSEGFKKRSQKILSFGEAKALLLGKVSSQELDYLVKEGHGESAERGLVNLTSKVRVIEYELKRKGRNETLFVMHPTRFNNAAEGLTQDDLGQALRVREDTTREFLYLDTACSASRDFCDLATGVAAVGFTPIGSKYAVDTFTSSDGDPVYELLHGIRNKRSYREMKARMEVRQPDGRGGFDVPEHGFVFPDSPAYSIRKLGGDLLRHRKRFSVGIRQTERN